MEHINSIEDIYKLSPMQQGMLFHTLYAPDSEVYREQTSCSLKGNLNVSAFQQAWGQVVQRHPILRTAFYWEELSEPLQVVQRQVELSWEQRDWRGLSPNERHERLEAFLEADRERGFDLGQAPLMRCALLREAEDTYRFVWSSHHLLLDGWSVSLLLKEVLAFYEAYCRGRELRLGSPRPYRDYIAWLQQQDLAQAEGFWREVLRGLTTPTPLPIGRSEGARLESRYAEQELRVSAAVTAQLQGLAREHRLTLNTLVQGAWAVLLSRYSGEEEVVFGATVSGRPAGLVGVEAMVGLFINTLPVRVEGPSQVSLLPWLQQLQGRQVEREQYAYSPLVAIQGWSEVPRGVPLFESLVVFENYPVEASLIEQRDGVQIREVRALERTNYPLTVVAAIAGAEFSLKVMYDAARFEAATIIRLLGHLQTLLAGMAADPEQRLGDLPLLPEAERQQVVIEWNATQRDYPQERCIHQLFETQEEQTPAAIGVVFENEQLTYRELNRRANQLAHYLQQLGVGPEVLVSVFMERSLEMVIGLYGILKAGGAYVPIDPEYPAERIAFMMQDSQALVLLTQQRLVERVPERGARLICLDTDWPMIARGHQENFDSGVKAEDLAYVIYTSGSTGRPKGAMNTHHGICNRLLWMQDAYQLIASDCVLQKTPFSFDVSVWEFFWPLLAGARLVVARPEGHKDSAYLAAVIVEQGITTLHFVPSMLQVFLQAPGVEPCGSLKRVVCSGEALAFDLQELFFKSLSAQLHNLYGPTEAAIDVTFWECKPQCNQRIIPIGRPVANTQMYVLDARLQPVPIGVPGELHIGGVQVGRGYLHRPELTAEKFIKDPFSDEPNARLYKTGDLARYLPDGNIEFLGRLDHQVKVRGFRIELGEIEAVLGGHPGVREVVVLAREDSPGEKRLVAYVVGKEGLTPSGSELRGFVRECLPEYMVPSAFVGLPALPLTPNGKVDRKALPAPDVSTSGLQEGFISPRDALELQLTQIWRNVLDVDPIGVKDNFFEVGGHSLLAVRLMAQIQRTFGKNLPLATLFEAPTIEQLADILRRQTDFLRWSPLVAIQPEGSSRPFFFMPGAGGSVFYFHALARRLGLDQPFYGLQARGLDGESTPHTRVEDIAAYNIDALQVIQPQGPYLLGGHSFGASVAFEMAQQLRKQGHEAARLFILDTTAPVFIDKPALPDDASLMADIATILGRLFGKNLEVSDDALRLLDPDEQLNYLKECLQMAEVWPPEIGTKQVRGLVQVFKANHQIHYVAQDVPQQVFPTRITLFQSSDDEVNPEDVIGDDQISKILRDATWGWSQFSKEPVEVHVVPGDHITMMTDPHVQVLAERLKACLNQVCDATQPQEL